MAKKRQERRITPQFILGAVMAGILIFIYIVSLVVNPQTFSPQVDESVVDDFAEPATAVPTPLQLPTVAPEGNILTPSQPFVNTAGMFQVIVPDDFTTTQNYYDNALPGGRINFSSSGRLAVLEVQVTEGVNFTSHQAVSDTLFDISYFFNVWRDYGGFTETSRTVGDSIVIDFEMGFSGQTFLARQVAWLNGDYLQLVRLVVPGNNPALLDDVLSMVVPSFITFDDSRGNPNSRFWTAYDDTVYGYWFMHPNWRRVYGEDGRPLLFQAEGLPVQLGITQRENTPLADLEAARTLAQEIIGEDGAVLSSQVTEREFASAGYYVSFSDRDNDGNAVSGLLALLNDEAGNLLVAEMRVSERGLDLLQAGDAAGYLLARDVLNTFSLLPPADVTVTPSENPPTPVPASSLDGFDLQVTPVASPESSE